MDDNSQTQFVVVKDIQMEFGSMVVFMVKWAIASIPALLILVAIPVGLLVAMGGLFGVLGRGAVGPSSYAPKPAPVPAPAVAPGPSQVAVPTLPDKTFRGAVRLLNVRMDGMPGFSGEVKNIGGRAIRLVEIAAIDRRSTSAAPLLFKPVDSSPLAPGATRAFAYTLEEYTADWQTSYAITVTKVEYQ